MNISTTKVLARLLESLILAAMTVSLCAAQPAGDAGHPWDAYVEHFLSDYFVAHPDFAVSSGKHEFDGQLPDWSEDGLQRELARLHAERDRALAFKDEQLDERGRFERDYLVAQIDTDLFWHEVVDQPHTSPFFYAEGLDPDVYITREYAPPETRIKSYTAYARNVPHALDQIKTNLKLPLPKTFVAIGRTTIGRLADFYAKDVPGVFASVKDATSQREFKAANEAAIAAVKAFDAWLAEQEPPATNDFALGSEKFAKMLKMTDGVDVSLDQLQEIAQRDTEKNWDALQRECNRFAPGKSVQECMTLAAARKAAGPNVIDSARNQLAGIRKFIEEQGVVSIPGGEAAQVAQAPSYKAWNFAYIMIPGAYETGLPSIYYVAPPDPSWSKEKQEAYVPGAGSLLFTSVHEVYPGHFVQFLHAHRSSSKIGRVFGSYIFAEGWAHYTEEMMYDAGLGAGDPELHIGQLQEALLRDVRFLSAIGLHTQGMTVEQSKRMFLERAFQDDGGAEQQANRGTFDPAYLNYTLGKLMIRKLRDDWTASRGGRGAWKQFHDEFLQYGSPPIPLIRRAMLGSDDHGSLL